MKRRVLLLLDSMMLFGRERGNIDVMALLARHDYAVGVAVHTDWAQRYVTPYLDRLGIRWHEVDYHDRIGRHTRLRDWIVAALTILRANFELLLLLLRERPTALQISTPQTLLNFLPLLWIVRTPIVYRCGDLPTAQTRAHRLLWRTTLRRVTRFVAISRFIASRLEALGCRPERLRVIHSRPFERKSPPQPFVRNWPRGRFCFGFLGQLEQHKGIDHLLEAAAILSAEELEFDLVMAGPGSDFADACLARWTGSEMVHCTGPIEDVAGFLSEVDVLVCPSTWPEALGAVVVEAKSAGVPAIVYPSGGLPELVRPGVDGWICEAPEIDALVQAMKRAMHEADLLPAMAEAARESASQLEREYERAWTALYDSL